MAVDKFEMLEGLERILEIYANLFYATGIRELRESLQELCHYQGGIRDVPGSWVALSTCRGLRGVIFDGENLYHIQPEDEDLDSMHYLYKDSDLIANTTCGKHLATKSTSLLQVDLLRKKRKSVVHYY